MYRTANQDFYNANETIHFSGVQECTANGKTSVRKRKSDIEIKLICLLLVLGNIFTLIQVMKIPMSFFVYLLESIIVASAVVIVIRGFKNMVTFLRNN